MNDLQLSDAPPATEQALLVLAILGRADRTTLRACGVADLAVLFDQPHVIQHLNLWQLDSRFANALLSDCEAQNPQLYRLLHEQVLAHLVAQFSDNHGDEVAFALVFERLANRLLSDDPPALVRLAQLVAGLPLHSTANQQLRRFVAAVALSFEDRYSEAIAAFDALLSEADLDETLRGRALNSRANCYSILGQPEQAIAGFRASLAIWERLGNQLRAGLAWLNLGIAAYDLHEYAEAEQSLLAAQSCFETCNARQWLAAAHNELGLVYRDQGRWEAALALFEQAAVRYQTEGATDPLSHVRNNIGEVYLFQARFAEAEAAFQAALASMQTRVHAVDVLLNLGLTSQAQHADQTALLAFQQALELAQQIDRRDILSELYYRIGVTQQRLGDPVAARQALTLAAEVIEATREPLRDQQIKMSLLGRWQLIYEALVLDALAHEQPTAAFYWSERARARAFADLVAQSASDQPASQEPISSLQLLQQALKPDEVLLSYFTTGVIDRAVPLVRLLPTDHPLRSGLVSEPRIVLFVVTAKTLRAEILPLDPNAFAVSSPRGDDWQRYLQPTTLARLQALLLAPAQIEGARRVVVAPHGPLHRVPFRALLTQELLITPSATLLVAGRGIRSVGQHQVRCVALGYAGNDEKLRLRHTEAEATLLAAATGGQAWVGAAPKLAAVRDVVGTARWLHIACHGWFNHEAPLRSYLLTGADERLTALEVLQHWRLNADLAVLSACQSGVSRVVRGDEPLGLIRAFLGAGARAVVVSLWPVEDLPTFVLMQRFYHELQQQPDAPALALWMAQQWLASASRSELEQSLPLDTPIAAEWWQLPPGEQPLSDPQYWAAFVIVGS
jgi:tetratricopeptide (TPR) repeat protein